MLRDNKKSKELFGEKEAEIRIMKRERSEEWNKKMDVLMENKRLQVFINKIL